MLNKVGWWWVAIVLVVVNSLERRLGIEHSAQTGAQDVQ
jgi:hypothetical protein